MFYVGLYLAVVVIFLALDMVWLRAVALPMWEKNVGSMMLEKPELGTAALFYAFYCVGVVYFAAAPGVAAGSVGLAFGNGLFLGLLAYGTYEATNKATLKGWTWRMLAMDTLWGGFLSGVSAAGAVLLLG
jgi:uncharacterized membrane protein